jgi:hypothetical protein
MSAPIHGVTCWAAISPPNKSSGLRHIMTHTCSYRRKYARDAFLGSGKTRDPAMNTWAYWRKKGWTIERVYVSAVQVVRSE